MQKLACIESYFHNNSVLVEGMWRFLVQSLDLELHIQNGIVLHKSVSSGSNTDHEPNLMFLKNVIYMYI